MSSVFSPHLYIRRFDREGHSHLFTLDARYADFFVAQTSLESPGKEKKEKGNDPLPVKVKGVPPRENIGGFMDV